MTPYEREITRQRAALIRAERRATVKLAASYESVTERLTRELRSVTDDIDAARKAGTKVTTAWLYRQSRYRVLLSETRRATIGFMGRALGVIQRAQFEVAGDAEHDVRRLGSAALGNFPPGVTMPHFGRLQPGALDRIIGFSGDGRPLGLLRTEIVPEHVDNVRDTLAHGVAAGRRTRDIALEVSEKSGLTLSRASTIARTEIARAQREASREVMADPDGVLGEWVWDAALDACASCQAQHGSIHPVTEPMASHPNCRCTMVPRPPSWAALGFDGIEDDRPIIQPGAERFAEFEPDAQLAILGPGKYEAYRTGRITLADLVKRTHSERWGPGTREASLSEALA